MIRFRYLAPAIAFITFMTDDESIAFKYIVPSTLKEAQQWARQTVIFDDRELPFYEKHEDLRENAWWPAKDGDYNAKVIFTPAGEKWQLM